MNLGVPEDRATLYELGMNLGAPEDRATLYILGMNFGGAPEDRATLYTGDELGYSGRSSNTIYWG